MRFRYVCWKEKELPIFRRQAFQLKGRRNCSFRYAGTTFAGFSAGRKNSLKCWTMPFCERPAADGEHRGMYRHGKLLEYRIRISVINKNGSEGGAQAEIMRDCKTDWIRAVLTLLLPRKTVRNFWRSWQFVMSMFLRSIWSRKYLCECSGK